MDGWESLLEVVMEMEKEKEEQEMDSL